MRNDDAALWPFSVQIGLVIANAAVAWTLFFRMSPGVALSWSLATFAIMALHGWRHWDSLVTWPLLFDLPISLNTMLIVTAFFVRLVWR